MPQLAGLLILTLCYWPVVAWLGPFTAVMPLAWLVLYGTCVVLGLPLWTRWAADWNGWQWARLAGYALFFALYLVSANIGLDVLHGVHRRRSYPEQDLGGMELWFVLFPGLAAVALGGLTQVLLRRRQPPTAPPPAPLMPRS